VVWCEETRNEYVILIGQHHGEENHWEGLDLDREIILKRILKNDVLNWIIGLNLVSAFLGGGFLRI
jgi:hypothetical protein